MPKHKKLDLAIATKCSELKLIKRRLSEKYLKKKYLTLEVTPLVGCSNMCSYCPQDKLIEAFAQDFQADKRVMSLNDFRKYIKTLPKSVDLNFTGYVEPFLNKESHLMIQHAILKGHSVLVNTTLMGLDLATIDFLRRIPYDRGFNIHLPSGSFNEMIGAQKPAKTFTSNAGVQLNYISDSYRELVDYLIEHPVSKQSFHCHGSIHPHLEYVLDKVKVNVRGLNSRAANLTPDSKAKVPPEFNIRGKCSRITQNNILPNGSLSLCCQDYGLEEIVGDLSRSSWAEIIESPSYKKLISDGANLCDYCWDGDDLLSK